MSDWHGDANPMRLYRARRWREVEAEYDEPIRDVIVGFRVLGCSWRTIAGALGVCITALRAWRRLLCIEDKRLYRDIPQRCKADAWAQELGYRNAEAAVGSMRLAEGCTFEQIAEQMGMSLSGVKYHCLPNVQNVGIYNQTERGRAVKREQAARALTVWKMKKHGAAS